MMNRRKFLVASAQIGAATLLVGSALEACAKVGSINLPPVVGIGPFTLPTLPFAVDALSPHIDAKTMEIHHGKHHQAYVDNLNKALKDQPELANKTLDLILANLQNVPEAIRPAVRNHGGGHYNHTFFWQCLSPTESAPSEKLVSAIVRDFGSMDQFMIQFTDAAKSVFGSGWAWLVQKVDGKLAIATSANQDNPLMADATIQGTPLLALDVWEHAYYLNYQNRRPDYITAFWNVANWNYASSRLA